MSEAKDPIEKYYQQKNDDAKHFSFVDFLLITPDVTAEQIFEHTGIRLSDFDYVEDGEELGTRPDEFRDAIIREALEDDWDVQQELFGYAIREGDGLHPIGDGWTFAELYQLHRLLKEVFEPRAGINDMVTLAQGNLELLAEPQPA